MEKITGIQEVVLNDNFVNGKYKILSNALISEEEQIDKVDGKITGHYSIKYHVLLLEDEVGEEITVLQSIKKKIKDKGAIKIGK